MIIMLRGHIRNTFQDNRLYDLIKSISQKNNIKIYIHTWNIVQSNLSWRKLNKIDSPVDENLIQNYFRDLNKYIIEILIDDDEHIQLEGNIDGFVSLTETPKKGWKNMWYGKKRLVDSINKNIINIEEPIVNIRFDIFTNSHILPRNFILKFIEQHKSIKSNKLILISNREILGIDNFYMGNFNAMFNLIYNFHYNLDDILLRHKVGNQEFLVFRENELMNYS